MAAKPVRISFIGDTADFRSSIGKASADLDSMAATAQGAGSKIDSAFESTAGHADDVASKGSQAAGALSGLGDLVGGKFGAAMVVGGTAMQGFADAGDLVNVITESNIVKKAKDIVVTGAHKAATIGATIATNAQTIAQRGLNLAMRANPIGLLITGLVLVAGALVVAYNKSETFRGIVQKVAGTMLDWRDKALDAIGAYRDGGGGILGKIWALVDAFTGLGSKITQKTSGMWDGLTGSFKSAINTIIGWWNNLSFSIDIPDKIPGMPDSFSITTPNIPMLANGGIVNKPTLAVIGEAGAEAVIPLDRLSGLGGAFRVQVELTAEQMHQLERGRRATLDIAAYRAAGGVT